jgi:hypothetical protein
MMAASSGSDGVVGAPLLRDAVSFGGSSPSERSSASHSARSPSAAAYASTNEGPHPSLNGGARSRDTTTAATTSARRPTRVQAPPQRLWLALANMM